MPIQFKDCASSDCTLTEWVINKAQKDAFVDALAYLYLQQERNALQVIKALAPRQRARHGKVAENVLTKLVGPTPADLEAMAGGSPEEQKSAKDRVDNHVAQRDGLLFQHVSWIAARLALPNGHLTAPHVRKADKGFDGFIIEFDEAAGTVDRVILCEDKASEDPRRLVRDSVWKEIKGIVGGERDDQILADLTTLLAGIEGLDDEAAEDAVDAMIWHDVRQFRVSVATGSNRRHPKSGYAAILKGFNDVAPGDVATRMGGVLAFDEVRAGLSALADDVADRVRAIAARTRTNV